jgi:hypothetical protein
MTEQTHRSLGADAYAAFEHIECGDWDRFLHRLHGAIHLRQKTDDYQATLIAGRSPPMTEQTPQQVRQAVWDYCELSAKIAEEARHDPYAVGLARAYRDVQAKIAPLNAEATDD